MRLAFSFLVLIAAAGQVAAAPCAERLTVVQGIIDRDLKTGFIGKSVHEKMSSELAQASSACQTGQEATAQSLITASQRRHGYPVH